MQTQPYNIFIEGIPGSGKTTLLNQLGGCLPGYHFYREGDISPVELAWCAYVTQRQYHALLTQLPDYADAIQTHSRLENGFYIIAYTQIRTDDRAFYRHMEQFELYGGRRSISEFTDIVQRRFASLRETGNVFECSFFQNIIEELMLFARYRDQQILNFYRNLTGVMDMEHFRMIRLRSNDLRSNILAIKKERVNERGEETWYAMMLDYLKNSPYGKAHRYESFEDVLGHFARRTALENQIIDKLFARQCIHLESKKYDLDALCVQLGDKSPYLRESSPQEA